MEQLSGLRVQDQFPAPLADTETGVSPAGTLGVTVKPAERTLEPLVTTPIVNKSALSPGTKMAGLWLT